MDRKIVEDRKIWMDLLKILSAYAIVLLHISGSRFYGKYGFEGFIRGLVLNAFTRFAVPCFLLVTGALTMEKKYSVTMALNRAKKYSLLLLSASFIYLIVKFILWQGFEENFLIMYIQALFTNNLSGHLWYLYQLVWIWMLIPFVQRLYEKISVKQRWYLAAITVLLPSSIDFVGRIIVDHPADFIPSCSITIHIGYIGILVLGGALNEKVKKYSGFKAATVSIIACACSLFFLVITTMYVCCLRETASDELFFELRLPALIYGCCMFSMFGILSQEFKRELKKREKYVIAVISDSLLYVYVWHCLLQWICGIKQESIVYLIILSVCQFLICILISCIGKKIQRMVSNGCKKK